MNARLLMDLMRVLGMASALMGAFTPAFGGERPELRQLIRDAGMVPWRGQPIPLDETLRLGSSGQKVDLRHYVTGETPLLVYMYGYW